MSADQVVRVLGADLALSEAAARQELERYLLLPGQAASYLHDLFRAREQPSEAPADPSMCWAEVAQRVEVHSVPGSHQNVVREPHVRELARQLERCLSAAQDSDR
ncbi:MAG: DUF885 domain-containing protein [bacterium]|nr:DUF885 domain-containing protein [bacterium]